ncbi:unnamed protein product, partial [marine sediment metagenome]
GEYYQTKTGLTSGHDYRFAAYADNSHGTGTGDWVEFTTTPTLTNPTVTTVKVSNITETSARLYGNITNTGGENCDERGFILQDLTSGTVVGPIYTTGSYSTGEYYQTKTGLTSGHDYRFAAYADNSHGTGTGDWVEFTTTPTLTNPTVTTVKVSNITETSARLYGNITNTGGENCDERGFILQDLTSGTVVGPIYTTGSYT